MNVKETLKIYCLYCKKILSDPKEMELGYHVSCYESFPAEKFPQEIKEIEELLANALKLPENQIVNFFLNEKVNYKKNENGKIIELDLLETDLKYLNLSIIGLEELQSLVIINKPEYDPHYYDYGVGDWVEKGLNEFPANISGLDKLKKLDLTGNNIKILPETLLNLSSLEILNLNFSKIKTFPENINRLTKLKKIFLNYFNSDIPPELTLPEKFGQLNQLEELRIYSTRIKQLPESFSNLKTLTTLAITGKELDLYKYSKNDICYLTQLPRGFGNLINLQYVDFSHNSLTYLPESFKNLQKLKTLDLNTQVPYYPTDKRKSPQEKLSFFPQVICELKQLENLNLFRNFIKVIPDSINKLENLKTLDIGDNKLDLLPESIGNLKNLRTLSVIHNHLTAIPETIRNLTNLQVLDISANKNIKTIPNSISKLQALQELYLQGTGIVELPNEIFELPHIKLGLTKKQAEIFSKFIEKKPNITFIIYANYYNWRDDTTYYRKNHHVISY